MSQSVIMRPAIHEESSRQKQQKECAFYFLVDLTYRTSLHSSIDLFH